MPHMENADLHLHVVRTSDAHALGRARRIIPWMLLPTLATIQCVLDEEDLESLLAMGAPKDEYETEARMIAAALSGLTPEKLTVERVTHIVSSVWEREFGPFHGEVARKLVPVCRRIAERILREG